MHGKGFDALDRKRRVDDVIVMAWVGARILRTSAPVGGVSSLFHETTERVAQWHNPVQ